MHEKSLIILRQDLLSELLIQEEHARAAYFWSAQKGPGNGSNAIKNVGCVKICQQLHNSGSFLIW